MGVHEVHEEQGGGFSCREGDVIRACCQWQPQLSKKRDFFPSMVPHEHVPYSLRNRDQGERNKTCPRLLSGLGHDRGTDRNRRASDYLQAYSVTGRQIRLAMLFLKGTSLLYSWIVVGIFTLQSLDSSNVEEANISTDKDGFWRLIG